MTGQGKSERAPNRYQACQTTACCEDPTSGLSPFALSRSTVFSLPFKSSNRKDLKNSPVSQARRLEAERERKLCHQFEARKRQLLSGLESHGLRSKARYPVVRL